MMNKLNYKGFSADISFSSEDDVFIGKVLDIDSLILFSATNVDGLKIEFHQAIDSYLEHCKAQHVLPEKPCKGTFNVRIGPDLHRQAATMAKTANRSLNDFVREAVRIRVQECVEASRSHAEVIFQERFPLAISSDPYPWSDATPSRKVTRGRQENSSHVYN